MSNVGGGLASLNNRSDPAHPTQFYPDVAHPASKTAVNMPTVQYAKAFPEMRINSVESASSKRTSTTTRGSTPSSRATQGGTLAGRQFAGGPSTTSAPATASATSSKQALATPTTNTTDATEKPQCGSTGVDS